MEENMATVEQRSNHEFIKPMPEIAVVTGTFYPNWYAGQTKGEITADKIRGDLALEALDAAQKNGFTIALVDGGSSEAFLDTLKSKGVNFEAQKEQGGQGPARRQGLDMISNTPNVKVIATTEPEKVSIVADCLKIAANPILRGKADIVVPKRGEEGFDTYPPHQAAQEKKANQIYNGLLRSRGLLKENEPDLDFWGGTRLLANRPEIVELFKVKRQFTPNSTSLHNKVRMDMYSNPLFHPVVDALEKGFRVKSVDVPYLHPQIQTQFEDGNTEFDKKRLTQRRTIITELLHLIRKGEGKKSRLQ